MYEIMKAINNFFIFASESSAYAIVADGITGKFGNTYIVGMYIVIRNSFLNDGIYKITGVTTSKLTLDATLSAEDSGEQITVGACKVPNDFITLSTEITTYIAGSDDGISSHSLGDLSVSYSGDSTWLSVFASRLNAYRKMYDFFDSAPARNRYRYGGCNGIY